jgi:hypothetical protein
MKFGKLTSNDLFILDFKVTNIYEHYFKYIFVHL